MSRNGISDINVHILCNEKGKEFYKKIDKFSAVKDQGGVENDGKLRYIIYECPPTKKKFKKVNSPLYKEI